MKKIKEIISAIDWQNSDLSVFPLLLLWLIEAGVIFWNLICFFAKGEELATWHWGPFLILSILVYDLFKPVLNDLKKKASSKGDTEIQKEK